MTTAEMLLLAADAFDLRATVLSHGGYLLPPCTWTGGARPTLQRVERLEDRGIYLVRLRPAPKGDGVVMRVTGPDADQVESLAPLAVRMRRVLQLDERFDAFRTVCRRQPALRPIAQLGLGRMLRGATLFEDIVNAIAPTTAIGRLGQLGSPCAASRRDRAFPTPAQIVRAGEDVLRDRVRLGSRAKLIGRLAREVCEGLRDLEQLDAQAARMPLNDLTAALTDIRVEPSAVEWLLLLLGRSEGLARWFEQWLASGHPGVDELRR